MMCYSVQPTDRVFVKGYGFLSFVKNMSKNIDKIISKSFSGKYCQKLFDLAKQWATDAFKTASKITIQKTEATGDLIANRIIKVSKNVQQNNLETLLTSMIKKCHSFDILFLAKSIFLCH